jgi:hypothetical protein
VDLLHNYPRQFASLTHSCGDFISGFLGGPCDTVGLEKIDALFDPLQVLFTGSLVALQVLLMELALLLQLRLDVGGVALVNLAHALYSFVHLQVKMQRMGRRE